MTAGLFALLNIHAAERGAFDDNEVRLIEEMASDLAYGIRSLRAHAQRDDAVAEHQRSLEQLRDNMEDTDRGHRRDPGDARPLHRRPRTARGGARRRDRARTRTGPGARPRASISAR
ncbi:MAG: hypothetical protein MZU91_08405 [Desulfosudis oleivorans]|nr:hypothetical protein [Desulfosudis oleivorans]